MAHEFSSAGHYRPAARPATGITASRMLSVTGVVGALASLVFWYQVHISLFGDQPYAVYTWTALRSVGPPVLASFFIPRTAGAMLLNKVRWGTWGQVAAFVCFLYLSWDSFWIQYAWWGGQARTVETGLVLQQSIIGLCGFVLIPALCIAVAGAGELVETIRSAHLVRRYEIQTQADQQILRNVLIRAQHNAERGFENLSPAEQAAHARTLIWLVKGIDHTLDDLAASYKEVTQVEHPVLQERRLLRDEAVLTNLVAAHEQLAGEVNVPDDVAAALDAVRAESEQRRAALEEQRGRSRRAAELEADQYRFLEEPPPTPAQPNTRGTRDLTPDGPPTAAALERADEVAAALSADGPPVRERIPASAGRPTSAHRRRSAARKHPGPHGDDEGPL